MTIRLEAFGGNDSRCPKCGRKEAVTDWCPPGIVNEENAAVEVREFSGSGRDLLRRECRGCSYMWYELPLDAPELENATDDPRDAEISALRKLIGRGWEEMGDDGKSRLDSETRRLFAIVARDQADVVPEGNPELAEEPDDPGPEIESAAPYFAPLRKP